MGSYRWIGTVAVGASCSLAFVAGASADPVQTVATDVSFEFSGTAERFRVPVGVDQVDVVACGAEGGTFDLPSPFLVGGRAGRGGEATSTVSVESGETLAVRVGGMGGVDGGYNGGGAAPFSPFEPAQGSAGGGASDIRQGGSSLGDRVVVGAGGGGGGIALTLNGGVDPADYFGGDGGGSVGADAGLAFGGRGASEDAGGSPGLSGAGLVAGLPGTLGQGGDGATGASGGGGGLFGGGGGSATSTGGGGGGGGSSLGDATTPGACTGDGSVTMSFEQPQAIRPFGALVDEGDAGSTVVDVPLYLLFPADEVVTVDWSTIPGGSPGLATPGADFIAASGTATFAPGQTETTVPVEVLADTEEEPDLLWGEWLVVEFSNPSPNALLDTNPFFGAGLIIIFDDDPAPVG